MVAFAEGLLIGVAYVAAGGSTTPVDMVADCQQQLACGHNAGSSPDAQAVAKSAKDVATRVLVMPKWVLAPFSPERDGKRNRAVSFIHHGGTW